MKFRTRNHIIKNSTKNYVDTISTLIRSADEIDCSLGVNPYGCSSLVANYAKNLPVEEYLVDYPDSLNKKSRKAISEHFQISMDNIRLGTGSAGLIEKFCKLFIDTNTHVLGFYPQFTGFVSCLKAYGGIYDGIPLEKEDNYKFIPQKLLNALKEHHTCIYIDNPSNPTGQLISLGDLSLICETALKQNTTVLVDEAYGDFTKTSSSAINILHKYENLVVIRSMSKGYGLASLRVGYLVASTEFLEYFDTINQKFLISSLAEELMCVALRDTDFIENSSSLIEISKKKLKSSLKKLTMWETSYQTPILTLMHPNESINLCQLLSKYNVISTGSDGFYGMPKNTVRIRIPENIDSLIDIINKIEDALILQLDFQ